MKIYIICIILWIYRAVTCVFKHNSCAIVRLDQTYIVGKASRDGVHFGHINLKKYVGKYNSKLCNTNVK